MLKADIDAFYADQGNLDPQKYLVLSYYFETLVDPKEAAAHLCQEMSTAQWSRVGVQEDYRPEFGAKVVDLKVLDEPTQPSSPFLASLIGKPYDRIYAVNVTICYPFTRQISAPSACWILISRKAFWLISRVRNLACRVCATCWVSMTVRCYWVLSNPMSA
jgi:hypothetical protein